LDLKSKQVQEFKETEIGKIPADWTIKKISELCIGIFDGPHATPKKIQTGPYFLGISSLGDGRIDLSKSAHISEDDFKRWTKRITPKFEDIVFSYETRLGQVAKIPKNLRCCLGRRLALMRPNKEIIIPDFLLYYYISQKFQNYIKANSVQGSTVDRILLTEFPDFKMAIPSLESQQKIVKNLIILDSQIENLQNQNHILEQMAQAIFKSWFVDFDGVTEFEDSELGKIPKGWKVIALQDFLEKFTNGLNPRKNFVLGNGKNYYVTIKNMKNNDVILDDKCDRVNDDAIRKINLRSNLEKNDVLLSAVATIGRVFFIDEKPNNWNINESVFTLRANQKITTPIVIYHLLLSYDFQNYIQENAVGSVQKGIRMSDMNNYNFALPDIETQREISASLTNILKQIKLNKKSIKLMTKTRNILLPKLMSGEIRV
jgi:type I restriction enzyme, S subunit